MIDQILHENEVKTNRTAVKILLGLALATIIYVILDVFDVIDIGPLWATYVILCFSVLMVVISFYIKIKDYDEPHIKLLVIGSFLLFSGLECFLFPTTTTFIIFGPILLSVRYYSEKFTFRVSVATWITYTICIVLNIVLHKTSSLIQYLHWYEGVNTWDYVYDTIVFFIIMRSVIIFIAGFVSMRIVTHGKKMLIDHAETMKKASEYESEMNAAAKIVNSTLPAPDYVSDNGKLKLYAGIDPARDVGGDFYDYFNIGENQLCTVIADVSDKGITAAMFSMRAMSAIRFILKTMTYYGDLNLGTAIERINNILIHNNKENMFVTAWIGCIDTRTGVGKYVNAGHMPPIIRHGDGSTELLENEPQLFIGMFKDVNYTPIPFRLNQGDSLILYTDGITDARNKDDKTYGSEGFIKTLKNADPDIYSNPKEAYSYLAKTVDDFTGEKDQFDDETIIVVNYNGNYKSTVGNINLDLSEEYGISEKVLDKINEILSLKNCPDDARRNIDVVIDEICTNVIDYGFEDVTDVQKKFSVNYEIGENYIDLEFKDNGIEFDPTLKPEFEDGDVPQVGGLGIHLIRNMTDEIKYKRVDGFNVLTIKIVWGI